MHWRIHRALLGERLPDALAWLVAQGDLVQVVEGRKRELPLPPSDWEGPGLALTTLQDAQDLPWSLVPGVYWDRQRYDVSHYLPRLGKAVPVLNRAGAFLPVGLLDECPAWLTGDVFIRPNSGQKLFPGQTLGGATASDWAKAYRVFVNTYHLAPEVLCWCAPAYAMPTIEWRVWVVNRQVAAWSPYSWNAEDPAWAPLPEAVRHAAQAMAANPWQPDIAYVADFAEVAGQAYLLELNAASTSGWYQVPAAALLGALREASLLEAAGELDYTAD